MMQWALTQETDLSDSDFNQFDGFWDTHAVSGVFEGKDGIPIHFAYSIPDNAHTAVVLSNGRVETLLKYKELIYDLYQNGFACFTLDHRGQGLSGRMTKDPQHGYVKDFDDYVEDLLFFVNNTVLPVWQKPINLLCHSMGGAIGALALIKYPRVFAKAVLCSPMFGIKPALPDWAATTLISAGLRTNRMRNLDSGYFFGQKPYTSFPFKVNTLTHSKVRYRQMQALYEVLPNLKVGGVTSEWLFAAREAMNKIEREAAQINVPVLVLSSGRDLIIDNKRQKKVAMQIPHVRYKKITHAFHELLMENDEHRNDAITDIFKFLTQR